MRAWGIVLFFLAALFLPLRQWGASEKINLGKIEDFSSSENTEEKIVITSQRSTSLGVEQISLIFSDEQAELVSNSNFLWEPGHVARLGLYQSPSNELLKTRARELRKIRMGVGRRHSRSDATHGKGLSSPHRLRIFIGPAELSEDTPDYEKAREILGSAWRLADWKAVDGVEAVLSGPKTLTLEFIGKKTGTHKLPIQKACAGGAGQRLLECEIEPYGWAHFYSRSPK